jgi:hypothetical protein
MRDNRLKLVPPENNASAVTDGTKELPNEPANPDSGRQLLRLVNSDEEHRRTTRRDRVARAPAGRAQRGWALAL